MATPIAAQKLNFDSINRVISNFRKDGASRHSLAYFETRLARLEEQWKACEELHAQTYAHLQEAKEKGLLEKYIEDYACIEDLVLEHKTIFKEGTYKYRAGTSGQPQPTANTSDNLQLERIKIPTFDGNYGSWIAFRDLFRCMIHENAALSHVQKMQYLRSNLKGEAEKLVSHLNIVSDNYDAAWSIFCERYDNMKIIAQELMQRWWSAGLNQTNHATGLRDMVNTTNQLIASLTTLKIDGFDLAIVFILNNKLDKESRAEWQRLISESTEVPTLKKFITFLTQRFTMLESLTLSKPYSEPRPPKRITTHTTQVATLRCAMCTNPHRLFECEQFKKAAVNVRRELVKNKKLCFNCLSEQHTVKQCKSKRTCKNCSKRHNTLLHAGDDRLQPTESPLSKPTTFQTQAHNALLCNTQVLLATALITVKNSEGVAVTLRALLDIGSQRSFITESAVQLLGLTRKHSKTSIGGIGCSEAITSRGIVEITALIGNKEDDTLLSFSALIIPKITAMLPAISINVALPPRLKKLKLADPGFNRPSHIDLLLGADIYGSLLANGFVHGQPCAQNTKLGWVLFGSTASMRTDKSSLSFVASEELDKTLRRFWEIEEPSTTIQPAPEDAQVERHYSENTCRNVDGTYTVMLPFKSNREHREELKESVRIAHIRFRQLEQRLSSHPERKKEYYAFMEEYLNLGHMEKVPDNLVQNTDCYYLPHHEVIKATSSTTRLRVVFNASQRSLGGKSLNDLLHVGPTIQTNLLHLLLRWRNYQYVVAADIEKMYRQIRVHDSDRDYQRILWRFSNKDPISHYRLNTVTYGTACAPFLAIRTLQQLAIDERVTHPETTETILQDFYVDDLLTGSDDLGHLKHLQAELRVVLRKGGFRLRKWSVNHQDLLEAIPEEDRENQKPLDIALSEEIKTLGLQWHPAQDVFSFQVRLIEEQKLTKRSILSEVARLFDPLGWLQPCIITGKITMQKLWLLKLGWDDEVHLAAAKDWNNTRKQLLVLEKLRIPRWNNYTSHATIELHGFCDASNAAYAAVVYVRVLDTKGCISTSLLSAKSRVAPLKTISIPRLELSSAVLLLETMKQVKQACKWTNIKTYYWTDSKVALAWLQKPAATWKVFVANRVSLIHEESVPNDWHHVSTNDNPADLASRGIRPEQLLESSLCWEGPGWLTNPVIPTTNNLTLTAIEQEVVTDETRSVAIVATEPTPEPEILGRYSSLPKLLKVMAYIRRFTYNASHPNHKRTGSLAFEELQEAKIKCIHLAQQHAFPQEIHALRNNNEISNSSSIKTLNPWIDAHGIIRVGGRLQHAPINEEAKHPAIISRDSFATLIVKQHHLTTLHGGMQLVLAVVRQQYWILNAQSFVKRILRDCLTCFKSIARPGNQLMGQLPPPRFQMEKPFAQTGLDYAGPITIKWNGGRGSKTTKAYIAVFVCLATKAFHLEAVSELSTPACIAAVRRFIARRGKCHTIYSDCGTNFVGSERQLKEAFKEATKKCKELLINEEIHWKFIPPGSPHFGGLWEAGVKSMKRHLIRTVGQQLLTIEELYTLLAQIEACLNSRPLCEVSSDPNDHTAITPGHFLTGHNLFEIPSLPSSKSISAKWESVQRIKTHFWNRWKLEYLSRLQQRPKWMTIRPNLQVGDLVLVKTDNFPSTHWPLARVTDVHPGSDGFVRVVSVKFHGRVTRRPITKICRLPFTNTSPEPPTEQPKSVTLLATAEPSKRKRPKIAPIGNTWSEYLSSYSKKSKSEPIDPTPTKVRTAGIASKLLYSLLVVLCVFPQMNCDVNITQLTTGFYIEHLGAAQVHRGALKIQLQLPWTNLVYDQKNIEAVVAKFHGLCQSSSSISTEIGSFELVHHLEELKEEIVHKMLTLKLLHHRRRRGALGTLLTAVFGVNDEVYKDINSLSDNQKKIIRSMNSQDKLMLKAVKTLNSTSGRIDTQLKRFQAQLQRGIERINELGRWYKTIDHNKISIHLLATYQQAENYLQEVHQKYSSLLSTLASPTSIWECMRTNDALQDINHTQTLLPDHMQILYQAIEPIQINSDDTNINLLAFLPIIDNRPYNLIKATPVPEYIGNNTFRTLDIPSTILGVNYNLQQYFEASSDDLSRIAADQYLVDISILHDVNSKPNCLINEIHKVFGRDPCAVHTFKIKRIVWKQLHDPNTWLFTTPSATPAQAICQGDRQNVILNNTGIIRLSQDCSLRVENSLFTASWKAATRNLSVYMLPRPPVLHQTISQQTIPNLSAPKIIKSEESFGAYIQQEQNIIEENQTTSWSTIGHHGTNISLSVLITLTITSACFLLLRYRRKKVPITPKQQRTTWYEMSTNPKN